MKNKLMSTLTISAITLGTSIVPVAATCMLSGLLGAVAAILSPILLILATLPIVGPILAVVIAL
ncbi:MAG: hypothetical protein ACRD4L_10710 [Pyrinomonadaceae bacterium]